MNIVLYLLLIMEEKAETVRLTCQLHVRAFTQ